MYNSFLITKRCKANVEAVASRESERYSRKGQQTNQISRSHRTVLKIEVIRFCPEVPASITRHLETGDTAVRDHPGKNTKMELL